MKAAIIMGSDSDLPVLQPALDTFAEFGVACEVVIASAHRTPDKVHSFAATARERGVQVIIAAAGAAAHLPGVVAAYTTLPVIGVPVNSTTLGGIDALLSIAQMPSGIPVATMAINGAKNAALFAMQILGVHDSHTAEQLTAQRQRMAEEVERKAQKAAAVLASSKLNQ
ncbi:MAG: 5-(carboxyamino)imidazole ribonucleotide mutase [Sporomusaceae bacterium]|nr:5-(carboxyamino)imidazole ribonucleotide mutase [Sporomusaceae bacterium]